MFYMIDAVAIRTLADEIGRLFRPERIVLFGSYASGSPTADSDVDLLVVMPFVGVPAEQAAQIRSRIRPPFSLDLIVRSPERMAQRLAMGDPFLNEIAQHGKVLYEAANVGMD